MSRTLLRGSARLFGGAALFAGVSLLAAGPAAAWTPGTPESAQIEQQLNSASQGFSALPAKPRDRKGPPGDNGTVKIHKTGTRTDDPRNEPHVCVFDIVGSGFDAEQDVWWRIDQHPPTGRETVLEGALMLDEKGHGSEDELSLPDGHYRLYWDFEGQKGNSKHKNFWVDCEDEGGGGVVPSPSPTPDPSGSPEPTPDPSGSPEPSPDPSGSPEPSPDPSGSPEPTPGAPDGPDSSQSPAPSPTESGETGGGLPVTGAALGGLIAAGFVAVAGGGAAVYLGRKRKSASIPDDE